MHLELDGRGERYRQLRRALERAITDGRLPPGARLPPTRELARALGLSRNTVLAAYELLQAERLIVSRRGSGTHVAGGIATGAAGAVTGAAAGARRRAAVAAPPAQTPPLSPPPSRYAARLRELPPPSIGRLAPAVRIDLQYGEPLTNPALFTAWRRSLSHAAARADPGYPPPQGLPALRRQIALHLARRRGVRCDADDVLIVNGTQQAISLLARTLLDEGDPVAIERPGYELTVHALHAHGAVLRHVPVDDDGIDVARLAEQPFRFVVVTPSHQFPTGAVMSLARREALLAIASARGAWVVEDDYDGEFGPDGPMLPALRSLDADDRVAYVGSFSKTVFPALRLGWLVCPRSLRSDLLRAKRAADVASGGIEQQAMAHFMSSGALDRHLRRTAVELRRRRVALLDGLAQHCGDALRVRAPGAGMHCVAWVDGLDADGVERLAAIARDAGLGLHPLRDADGAPSVPSALLLGYAGLSLPQIRLGTRLLGRCLARALGTA